MKEPWDPLRIISQIVMVQFAYYVSLSAIILLYDLALGHKPLLDQIWDYRLATFTNSFNSITLIGPLIVAFSNSFVMMLVVIKPRKILDFSMTKFLLHFVVCWFYGGFPLQWLWWLFQGISTLIETLLSEYLCVRREIQEMPKLAILHV